MSKVTDTWPHPLAKKAAEGCCGNDNTRGYLCDYHNGYAAGVDDVAALFTDSARVIAAELIRFADMAEGIR